ncbi:MAG: hypothetical protein L3K13_06325 [Thermoplasmata archaeon]|nr:hypothetical protein [Thermoplasmata archaeon]
MTAELVPPSSARPAPATPAASTHGAHPFALAPQPKPAMSGSRHLRALLLFLLLAIVVGGIAYPLAEAGLGTLLHAPAYPQPAPTPVNNTSTNTTFSHVEAGTDLPRGTAVPSSLPLGRAMPLGAGPNERLLYERGLGAAGAITVPFGPTPSLDPFDVRGA